MNSCLSDVLEGDQFGRVSVQGSPQDPHQQNQQQATYEWAQMNMMPAGQLTRIVPTLRKHSWLFLWLHVKNKKILFLDNKTEKYNIINL